MVPEAKERPSPCRA